MSDSNSTEIEQGIGSEVDHFIVRAPKKNHDAMIQLGKQFSDILRKYGGPNPLYFQLNNTETSMEGITNIAKTASSSQDEEDCMEQIFFRDSKHKEEYIPKCASDDKYRATFTNCSST